MRHKEEKMNNEFSFDDVVTKVMNGEKEIPFTLNIMERIYEPRISKAEWELKGHISRLEKRVAELEKQVERLLDGNDTRSREA
jgi:polyhydroxyalkanoate synthesis regulator phasin